MRKISTRTFAIIYIILIAVISFVAIAMINKSSDEFELEVRKGIEQAYFLGQKDALSGKVCITELPNGKWTWKTSPYGEERKPLYNPLE